MNTFGLALGAILFFILMFLNVPVFASVAFASITYIVLNPELNNMIIVQRIIGGTGSIALLAIPFFVCAGILMNYTGITKKIMGFCEVLTGHMAGGLAQVNVVLSTMMGGLSGSSIADAAMEAKMLVPEMERNGYSKAFSSAVTAASAIITPIIPPGIGMVIFGCVANVSIGGLFMAGILPGILTCFAMMALVSRISKKRGYLPTRERRATGRELLSSFRQALLPLLLPVVIIGGIRIGIFTATEAGAVAIAYALLLGFVIYKELNLPLLLQGIRETVAITASIMLIVGVASAFAWVLTWEQVPQQFTDFMLTFISNKYVFLFLVNIFLIIVGMFIEGNASMIVLIPLLLPIARSYGINDFHFAMIFLFNGSVGAFTPPMGTLMFVTCSVTHCRVKEFMKECIPFYLLLFGMMMLITYVPFVSIFLPTVLGF
ncbi:TRAP transporter large permease [Anaerotruncus sp. AF02-27]|uniref:TRAP transporter large permease n=1 Tax=Anaerotruncus sp. AF02-27 TaxID=2292191 RepID=UPI000E51907D|nr:TRAP transporter large permease [Anaerotruncus sp. AF02-27]RGX57021.1 TRAP transporter large permease [Anaerotruncus sp. AF02-27]